MTAGEAAGRHLVVVHGVGVHPLGALRDRLAADLLRPGEIAHRRDAYLGGRLYPSLEIGDPRRPRLRVWEVHWSDLAPAPRRGVPLLSFVIQLVSAMVRLAARGWREDGRGAAGRSRVGAWFRVVFATLLVWAISVPTMLRLAAIVANPLVAAAAILAVAAVVAFLAARFAAAEPLLRAGYGWAVATALVGLAFALHPGLDPASAGALARAVGAVPLLGALMLPLAVVELTIRWARDRHLTGEPALVLAVRLALFVLVVLLLSAALAVVWAASLWASELLVGLGIADGAALTAWNAAHYDASLYNIDLMELVNGGAAFLAGTYLLAAFALWAALTHLASPLRLPTGRILRAGLRLFFPLLLALAGGVMVVFVLDVLDLVPWLEKRRLCDVPHLCDFWGVDRAVPDSARLTAIYTLSAARLLPFLALLVGPMRLALDVAADVLLYLDRSGPAATGDEARARLARLLDHLAGAGASEVAVFAHGQCARIAVDALAARPPADCHGGASGEARMEPAPALRLVTVGAPLDTLYARFLHLAAPVPAVAEWWNLYRPSDFVGGPIARGPCHAPRDQVLARHYRRSHFDYWGEAEVLAAALGTRT
jgi:hypothetical protein